MKFDIKKHWPILVAAIGGLTLGFLIGAASAPVKTLTTEKTIVKPVEKRVEVTPQSCKTAIEIDTEVFNRLAETLATDKLHETVDYMENIAPKRVENADKCLAS